MRERAFVLHVHRASTARGELVKLNVGRLKSCHSRAPTWQSEPRTDSQHRQYLENDSRWPDLKATQQPGAGTVKSTPIGSGSAYRERVFNSELVVLRFRSNNTGASVDLL